MIDKIKKWFKEKTADVIYHNIVIMGKFENNKYFFQHYLVSDTDADQWIKGAKCLYIVNPVDRESIEVCISGDKYSLEFVGIEQESQKFRIKNND